MCVQTDGDIAGKDSEPVQEIGVIGYPLRHSISPIFQQAAIDHLGLALRYQRWETPPEQLADRMATFLQPHVLGANVTVPHKQAVITYLDSMDDLARRIGAVNTIAHRGGRLMGYNTDAPGFLRALEEDGQFSPRGQRVLLLGAGGAARAVAFALLGAGAARLSIANRTGERAEALAADLRRIASGGSGIEVVPWNTAPDDVALIVNTTTLGMKHGPAEHESPLDGGRIPSAALVCDLVYNPTETPLLREARKTGARILGGLPMLVYQGAIAFEIWTGRQAPVEVMFAAAKDALSRGR